MNISFLFCGVALVFGLEAPYGRYNQEADNAQRNYFDKMLRSCNVNPKLAWTLQELPTLINAAVWWAYGRTECTSSGGNRLVMLCFVIHYVNRCFIYPLRMKGSKPVPVSVMLMALVFCATNGYLQCRTLSRFSIVSLGDWTTPVGLVVWAVGLGMNHHADHILRNLRKPGETGYKIPRGGMFEYVSGANFLGEIVEWIGFAILSGCSLTGLTFAICTACNIGPRAWHHHQWYLTKFKDDYPKTRKALIPFVL